jgi:hypothetical protein
LATLEGLPKVIRKKEIEDSKTDNPMRNKTGFFKKV